MKIKTVKEFARTLMDKVADEHWPTYKVLDAWHEYALTLEEEIQRQNEKITKLKEACELGLEFAQEDLIRTKLDFAGYPDRWELTEIYIKQIEEVLNEEH